MSGDWRRVLQPGDRGLGDSLWATVAFTIVVSVLIHGILAKPVMTRL